MFQLDKGIFLEDKNILLEWGQPAEKLALKNRAEIIRMADRTVIEWGKHTILDGLTLELSNLFLKLNPFAFFKKPQKFKSINYKTVGDKKSFDEFDSISKHLLNKFGNPAIKEDSIEIQGERYWVWQTKEVKISLFLFEQHAYKLHLTIEQNR